MTSTLHEVTLTDRNFRKEVLESNETVLVDFTADWLAQCKNIPSVIKRLGKALNHTIKHARARVNECYRTAEQYGVRAFPTFVLFKNGEPVAQVSGTFSEEEMLGRLKVMLQTNG